MADKHRASSSQSNLHVPPLSPHSTFFRPFLPIVAEKMILPAKFVRLYGSELKSTAEFSLPNAAVSVVGVEKARNEIRFADGWVEFVDRYSIDNGYFLRFDYLGDSKFSVKIYDLNCCGITYRSPAENEDTSVESFYRIIHSEEIPSKQIRLPFKFAVKHGRKLGTKKWSNGQLRLPNGEVFEVGLTKGKEPKFLFFKRGWTKFMMENSIKEDFFLTFEYVDRSRFNLRIFDKSATEIVYKSPAPDPEQEWKAVVEELLAKGIHVVKTFRRVFCNMSSRTRIALRSAMNSKAVEKFPPPSFVFMIQSTNPVTRKAYFFTVPHGIVEELEIRGGDTVNLRVSGVGSDGFEVNLEKIGSSIRIAGGEWIRFYDENELKSGDVCHFQAVESLSIGFEFEVSIFRA
ncbi:B3 domain-containing transcription factor VRN1 [Linum perenne]